MNSMNRTMRPVARGEGGEVEDLVVVAASQQHHVHLHGREPGRLGGIHGPQNVAEVAPPADRRKALGSQGVTAHVHPSQTGRGQLLGHAGQLRPVGGHRQVLEPERGQPGDEHREPLAHERLPAGDPHCGHTEAPGHASHPRDLVEREELVHAEEREPRLGHAVDAAQVAAIGDRDAKVVVHTPVAVDKRALQRHGGRRILSAPVRSHRDGDADGSCHGATLTARAPGRGRQRRGRRSRGSSPCHRSMSRASRWGRCA